MKIRLLPVDVLFDVPVLPRTGDHLIVDGATYVAGPCQFDGGTIIRLHVTPLVLTDSAGTDPDGARAVEATQKITATKKAAPTRRGKPKP